MKFPGMRKKGERQVNVSILELYSNYHMSQGREIA